MLATLVVNFRFNVEVRWNTHTHTPEPPDDGDLLLRDIPPALGEEKPCTEGSRPYEADFATLHSRKKEEIIKTFELFSLG